ncbi:MAG: TonB-dependent receptor plug domain-containing protein, partial [bacterium]
RREGNTCANCHNPEGRGNAPLSYPPFDPEEEIEVNEKIFGRLETTAKLNKNHLVTAGIEYQIDRTDRRVVLLPNTDKDISTQAGYLQDQIGFGDGRLTLILGGRYDDHEVVGGNLSSRVLGAYSPSERLTLRAGWSTGVRAPTWTELNLDQYLVPGRDPADTTAQIAAVLYRGNRDLREETIRSFDVGGEYRFSDNFGAKASLFYSRLDRFIGLRQKPEVGSNYDIHTWENSPRGKLYGGELELHLRGGDLLKSLIHYTYQKVDVGREPSLNPSYAPRHKIFTQLTLTPTKMLKIYGIVSHWRDFKSSYFRLGMPLEPFSVAKLDLDPYTMLETTVTYMIPLGAGNRMIMLSLVGENLLDDERAYYSRAAANIVDSHNLGRQYMFMIMYMF